MVNITYLNSYPLGLRHFELIASQCVILIIRLKLFNHVLVLFHAKFAYNLAIRHPVFRWKLCKVVCERL